MLFPVQIAPTVKAIPIYLSEVIGKRPYAFAPTRTHPQRTYDPLKADPRPERSHIPMVLSRLYGRSEKGWGKLTEALENFGKASGLFKEVRVRRIGDEAGNPFQIKISVAGSSFNLIDVGYGVSQVLPILVDCLRAEEESTFLLQQPEVHLHPRAQAELASFLGLLAKNQNKRFVIETHSDHIVDRIRMDLRDGRGLTPEDLALLYFERDNGLSFIRHLEIDEQGNLRKVPASYRRFFLEEEKRLLLGGRG